MNIVLKKIIILVTAISGLLLAGTDGTIRGQVSDMDGKPLPGAQIFIQELSLGAVADVNGNYIILNIPVGVYDVTVLMMGYQKQVMNNVDVIMDKTIWLNFSLPVEAYEGDEVIVVGQRELVEKGSTSKKVTIDKEAVEALPLRDLSELYSLQSGVVKVESRSQGIPDHEERGLEEIHVRGGRSGEIAYMIDGLYIRNPIFGGIGNGTRLNLFAVQEFDWQPGGFNAEYGDAMSAVSNMHTNFGGDEFSYKFKWETSDVGAALGSEYDALRGLDDINIGFGGPVPFLKKINYWVSGQYTNKEHYRVYEFDDMVYVAGENDQNIANLVQPWDTEAGFRGFGFDKTWDIFGKLAYNPSNRLRMNLSFWDVVAHRKGFNTRYLYWDEGQNELFRDTQRYTFEFNHTLTKKTFYTVRLSRFIQDQFQGVRWTDSDEDGFPDWFEWRYSAGADRDISDPNDPTITPYTLSADGDTVYYTRLDDRSGWYYGAKPGYYNWSTAEDFTDKNGNGIYDEGVDSFSAEQDANDNGVWDGPELTQACVYRDGSYWLLPNMYESYEDFEDYEHLDLEYSLDPYWLYYYGSNGPRYAGTAADEQFYFMPTIFGGYYWDEGSVFGGSDNYYADSRAVTSEARVDFTSQLSDKWRLRSGLDYKTHRLNFYQVKYPWLGEGAFIQSFAEYWNDTGADGLLPTDEGYETPDFGENNGKWDAGETFDDANQNGQWDDYREPEEFALYIQNTYEVPWMVINAGVRVDAVNYNTRIWADTTGEYSAGAPWYYNDQNGNGKWDAGEPVDDSPGFANQRVIFAPANWFYKISPRLGFSHVITDAATFTFNYGVYYQTPIYQNVYLNTNRMEDPEELFEEGEGYIGNATMTASRTQSYEFAFNIQFSRKWAFTLGGWVKYMDQLVSYQSQRSGVYTYQVFSNADYGNAKGIDFSLTHRGTLIHMLLQYTYSVAKANSEYDWAALGAEATEAASQEYLMPYDRPHDLTLSLYSKLPFGIQGGVTGFYQSGYPYTPKIWEGNRLVDDELNKYSKRMPAYKNINVSFSKQIRLNAYQFLVGLNIFNAFNFENALDIYELTGEPDDPGEYYTDMVGLPDSDHSYSSAFFDSPWMYYSPREINFFIQINFR